MRTFYFVPTATLNAIKPRGAWHATPLPGVPSLSLCMVEYWNDDTADEDWEALPGVRPLRPEEWGQPIPAAVVSAVAPWGVVATDTIRQALAKIRQFWGQARP